MTRQDALKQTAKELAGDSRIESLVSLMFDAGRGMMDWGEVSRQILEWLPHRPDLADSVWEG